MKVIKEYQSLQEKALFFTDGDLTINTKDAFDKIFEELIVFQKEKRYKFRGVGEARYAMYNATQRYWLNNKMYLLQLDYHDFVKSLIRHSREWNQRTIANYLTKQQVGPNNALAYLSYMKYYGIPTPMVNFSHNPFVGLFFAMDRAKPIPAFGTNELDAYCSLYFIDEHNMFLGNTERMMRKSLQHSGSKEIDYDKHLRNNPLLMITNEDVNFRTLSNPNIINQEGIFLYTKSPDEPLEDVYLTVLAETKADFGDKLQDGYTDQIARCYNIHKGLIPYALRKIGEMGVNRDFMFPDHSKVADFALQRSLEELK